jgi:hypothetical protein
VRRRLVLAAVLLALSAAAAPTALADSIVFERGGNVWLANPDGSGQRQLTKDGGYSRPSQSDDGTIVAANGSVLHRLSRSGALLGTAGDDDYGGKIFTDTSPNGALASYGFFANGPILEGPYAAVSHTGRPTEKEEIDGPLKGYLNPTWLDSNRLLIFPQSLVVDVQIWPVPGDVQDWFADGDVELGGGEVDRAMTKFAATANGGSLIRIYNLPAPPPALPVPACEVSQPTGSFFRPTWSPEGSALAFQEDDGIHVGRYDLASCSGSAPLVIPGGKHPDWGPAPAGPALAATAPRRIRLSALLNGGVRIRVSCTCTARATLLAGGRAIGRNRRAVFGSAAMRVKPNRAGKARLRAGGRSVSVRVTGAARRVTRKVRVLR